MSQEPEAAADADHVRKLHALAPASTALASAAGVSEHGHKPNGAAACHTGRMQALLFSTPKRPSQLRYEKPVHSLCGLDGPGQKCLACCSGL